MLILFCCILLVIFWCVYVFCGMDIFSPATLFSLSYFCSAVCCLYHAYEWGTDLSLTTMLLILLAVASFWCGELFVKRLGMKDTFIKKCKSGNKIERVYIDVRPICFIFIFVIEIAITALLYHEIVRIANLNFASWGNLIYNYKTNSNNIEGASFSPILTIGLKLSKAVSYVFGYIFINNIFYKKTKGNIAKNIFYLMPFLFAACQSLLKGVRVAVLTQVLSLLFFWYLNMQIEYDWNWHIKFRHVVKISLSILILCILFYSSKGLVGRIQDDTGVISYVTTYLGGPIQLLDLFVRNPINSSNVIETMGGVINSLKKIGLFKSVEIHAIREYRNTVTGMSIGNVYGAVRDYYHDFGYIGVLIFFFFDSILVNSMFYKIKQRKDLNIKKPILSIVYSTFIYAIIFLTFSDFLTAKLAFGELMDFILIAIVADCILHPERTRIVFGKYKI